MTTTTDYGLGLEATCQLKTFDRLTCKFSTAYQDVPEDEGLAEIEAVVAQVRAEAQG